MGTLNNDSNSLSDNVNLDDIIAPSSDISEYAADSSVDKAEENIMEFIQKQNEVKRILNSPGIPFIGEIKDSLDSKILNRNMEDFAFSGDEGNLYYTAFRYHQELIKRAKGYFKDYCRANGLVKIVERSLKDKGIGRVKTKDFNPFLYSIYTKKRSEDNYQKVSLVENEITMDEANLKAAYKTGYITSYEYKSIPQMFHIPTVAKILEDKRYFEVIRERNQIIEQSNQIAQAHYISSYKRDEWLQELKKKVDDSILKVKGGI